MNAAVDENHCNGQNDSEEPEDNGHSGVPLSDTLGKLITNSLQRALVASNHCRLLIWTFWEITQPLVSYFVNERPNAFLMDIQVRHVILILKKPQTLEKFKPKKPSLLKQKHQN